MVGLAFVVVAPRAFDIGADPADYAIYGTSWQDEGFWNYPSAWAAVAGRWPDFPPPIHQLVPLYSLVQRWVFGGMGPGLLSARSLSIVGGILACLGIWSAFRRLGSRWQGCATLVYATSFWCVAVDRLAVPEAISICFLVWATRVLAEPGGSGQRAAWGLILALTSVLFKPVAAFFLPVAALATIRGLARPFSKQTIAAVVVTIASAGLLIAGLWSMGRDAGPLGFFLQRLYGGIAAEGASAASKYVEFLYRELVGYEFAVHHTVPIVGIILGLAVRLQPVAPPLASLSWLWLLSWWLLMPLTGFRTFRYAYVVAPLTVLGVLGFHRWTTGGRSFRLSPAGWMLAGWLMAMWSMWLSDRTGIPARVWFPLAACCAALAVYRATRIDRSAASAAAPLVFGMVAASTQAVPFTNWLMYRTHLVVDAERRVAGVSFEGYVCGIEAPNLLLSRPTNGPALTSTYIWNPDCRVDGRLADYVVVPDAQECTAYESPFVRENFAALAQLPALVSVRLPSWRGTGSRSCRYSVVALREGMIQPR